MAEHTPTPWRADSPRKFAGVKWDNIIRSARRNDPICSVFVAGYMEKEAAANAAFIVKAVNAHDALVKALQKVRAYNVDIADGRMNYRPMDHIQVIDEALTVLVGGVK